MNEKYYISIKDAFFNFKDELTKDIESSSISMKNKDCYLIEESWHNEFINNYDKYLENKTNKKIKKIKKKDFLDFLPEILPEFINNFSSIINCLSNNRKMIMISSNLFELIESIYEKEENELIYNKIKYYSGNKKLIIKFKDNDNNKVLLLNNHINGNIIQNINNIFIISVKNKEKNEDIIYKQILSEKNIETKMNVNYNIISLEKYLNILKLLVYIYYYEIFLSENNEEDIFKGNEDYYLINPDWVKIIKKCYNSLFKSLRNIEIKTNYNNLKKYFIKITSLKNNLNIKNNKLFEDIMNIEKIKPKNLLKNEILFYQNCYIINSEIMDIIISIFNNKELDLKNTKIFVKNENIYLICSKNIIIGNLNEKLFIPNFIISFNSNYEFNYSDLQVLTDENDERLGKLEILLNKTTNKENDSNQDYKNISLKNAPKYIVNNINISNDDISLDKNMIKSQILDKNNISFYRREIENNETQNKKNNNLLNSIEILNINKQLEEYKNKNEELLKENLTIKEKYEKKESEFINEINELKEKIKEKEDEYINKIN